jgi:hypothetical protein
MKRNNFWSQDDDNEMESHTDHEAPSLLKTAKVIQPKKKASKIKSRPLAETKEIMMSAIMSFEGQPFTTSQLYAKIRISRIEALEAFRWFWREGYLQRFGRGVKLNPYTYKYIALPQKDRRQRSIFF